MIIGFTPQRFAFTRSTVLRVDAPELWGAFEVGTGEWEGQRVGVTLPAVGWRRVYEVMIDAVYNSRGNKRREVTSPAVGALRDIRTALNFRERHPAMKGKGMLGWKADIFPAWVDGDGFSPYPNGDRFVILLPMYHRLSGRRVTTWSEGRAPVPDPLFEELTHLRLCLQVQPSRVEHHR